MLHLYILPTFIIPIIGLNFILGFIIFTTTTIQYILPFLFIHFNFYHSTNLHFKWIIIFQYHIIHHHFIHRILLFMERFHFWLFCYHYSIHLSIKINLDFTIIISFIIIATIHFKFFTITIFHLRQFHSIRYFVCKVVIFYCTIVKTIIFLTFYARIVTFLFQFVL